MARRTILLLTWAALAAGAAAQTAVTGRVTDAETGAPLPGVHVYVSGTSTGAVTDRDGAYRIDAVPEGADELVASFVGYAPGVLPLGVRAVERATNFRLRPRPGALGGVTVEADRSAWLGQLAVFTRGFVGGGVGSRDVRLVNPEVLAFDQAPGGALVARTEAPLVVENRALGYRVVYDLTEYQSLGDAVDFRGYARFEALGARDDAERARWAAARRRAYAGSFAHFVHTLAADGLGESAFRVYRTNERHRLPPAQAAGGARLDRVRRASDVLRPLGPGLAALSADPALYLRVDYTDETEDRAYLAAVTQNYDPRAGRRRPDDQVSWVETPDGVARVDLVAGQLAGGRGARLSVSGYWAWDERATRWLPADYRPDGDL